MHSRYKFSIITINYNGLDGLKQSMNSVLKQTFNDYEYIVIDGGSRDGSRDFIEAHKDRLDYWISEKDNGIYYAMNKGLVQAKGEYVYFLNSGDTFYSNTVLQEIDIHLTKEEFPDLIYGNIISVHPKTNNETPKNYYLNKIALWRQMISHQSIFCKKEIFSKHGFFDTTYKIKADYEWLLRAMYQGIRYSKIEKTIAKYEEGGLSEALYDKYSVKEIPRIRNLYFSEMEQINIRKFIFNGRMVKLPIYRFYLKLATPILKFYYPGLR